jgi:cysteine desulfurase/selenocysteine lyase
MRQARTSQPRRFHAEIARRSFPGLRGIIFLNAASMGIASQPALAAIEGQVRLLRAGPRRFRWSRFSDLFERGVAAARLEASRLLGAERDEVGLIGDTTSGLHHAIEAIPFEAGDNVVLSDLEYPQVALAAANARREWGVELRFVAHRAGRLSIEDVREAIDSRTRALLVSSVGWVTGERLDLGDYSELAARRDLFLVVDSVQQLGSLSIDCSKLRIDFLMSGGYKWLNAPFGCGVFYVRRAVHERGVRLRRLGLLGLEEPASGWGSFYASPDMTPLPRREPSRTVRRFEAQGTPNRLGAAGLAAALRHRNSLDGRRIDRHILELGAELIAELAVRRAKIWTPREEPARAGIVTFTLGHGPTADEALRVFLERRRIYTSVRYCSGVGGVRVAIHLFNVREDLRELLAAIDAFQRCR